jgi:hypothetical protein
MPGVLPPGAIAVEVDRPCVRCSYNLRGLPVQGVCPECGTPVEQSLKGILLRFAAPEYLAAVESGLALVLYGILLQIILMVAEVIAGFAAAASRTSPALVQTAANLIGLVPVAMILVGYWRFTQPDPGFQGIEPPASARSVARVTVIVQAIANVISVVIALGVASAPGGGPAATVMTGVAGLLGFVALAAWAVQFFAIMRYTRWMAGRVPDRFIVDRTRTYVWLLPLLSTVGVILIGLGPLAALILYWNLLNRLHKHAKSIRATSEPASLPGLR